MAQMLFFRLIITIDPQLDRNEINRDDRDYNCRGSAEECS